MDIQAPAAGRHARAFPALPALPAAAPLTFGLLAACCALSFAMPAQAATAGPIKNAKSGRCLDVSGASTTPRTPVIIYDCNGGTNQAWEATAAGELRTFGGTRCLDVRGASTASQAIVQSYTCSGGANQKWTVNANGSITSQQSGLCLTAVGGGTANSTGVDMYACQGVSHQKWTVGVADTTPPTTPGALTVSVPSCRSATLAWGASTDNVGVAFYDLYHDGQLILSVGGSVRSATINATPGALWGFYVNARDAAGNVSQASNTVSTRIPQCEVDTQPPTAPTQLRGSATGTTISLQWNAATDNIAVAAYDVFRNDIKVGATPSLAFSDSGLAPNTTYRYAVAARDAQANVSARTAVLSLTTGQACANAICTTTQVGVDTDIPWGLLQLPDGSVLYSRRDAQNIVRMDPLTGAKTSIGTIPNVTSTDGEGGLLGIAATPGFPATDPWLYIYHTSPTDNRIIRMRYANGVLDTGSLQVLLAGIGRNKFHNGGRLRFGPDGKLYASTGDAQNGAFAQDLNSLSGKILRLNADGSVPSDNPYANYVWSLGHRNPQGLAFDSQGRLWEQEFGNSQLDETNLITKGGNYGWPDCEGTISQGGGGCARPGYIAPKYTYSTATGSCSGIAIVRDALYIACERGERLYRAEIGSGSFANVQQLYVGTYGRLRTVEPTIDGGLWLSTSTKGDKDSIPDNSDEKIFKVTLGR